MIKISCKLNNKDYDLVDKEFVLNCKMLKITDGEYIGAGSEVFCDTFNSIMRLGDNKNFLESVKKFTRNVDGEIEDILEFYKEEKVNGIKI